MAPLVNDDLVRARLSGQPGTIELVSWIVVIGLANHLYQFLFISWFGVVETQDGSKNPNPVS